MRLSNESILRIDESLHTIIDEVQSLDLPFAERMTKATYIANRLLLSIARKGTSGNPHLNQAYSEVLGDLAELTTVA